MINNAWQILTYIVEQHLQSTSKCTSLSILHVHPVMWKFYDIYGNFQYVYKL